MDKVRVLSLAIRYRILELCADLDISVYRLCVLSGVSHSTISEVLNGKTLFPKIDTLEKLCLGIGISLSEFFDNSIFQQIFLPSTGIPS